MVQKTSENFKNRPCQQYLKPKLKQNLKSTKVYTKRKKFHWTHLDDEEEISRSEDLKELEQRRIEKELKTMGFEQKYIKIAFGIDISICGHEYNRVFQLITVTVLMVDCSQTVRSISRGHSGDYF